MFAIDRTFHLKGYSELEVFCDKRFLVINFLSEIRGHRAKGGILWNPVKSVFLFLAMTSLVTGMIFRDGPSPAPNTETAPTGDYENSGWQWQIYLGGFHGTMISPKHILGATHTGNYTTANYHAMFSGEAVNQIFQVKSRTLISGTDLAVYEVWETFDDYAQLYSGTDEQGKELVVFGRGVGRGTEELGKGWRWGSSGTKRSRWGRNTIQGDFTSGTRDLLYLNFSDVLGQDEVGLTTGDSGGGWFIEDGGVWKLAGVSYAVDARYSADDPPSNTGSFNGVFYNAGGWSIGSDANGWNEIPLVPTGANQNSVYFWSNSYGSRVSSSIPEINAVIGDALVWGGLTSLEKFDDWLSGFGLVGLPGEDADGDCLSHLSEYLTNSDPSSNAESILPFRVQFLPTGEHEITLVHTLDLVGRGLSLEVQRSEDLQSWSVVSDLTEQTNTIDRTLGVRTIVSTRTEVSSGDVYYRLKITL